MQASTVAQEIPASRPLHLARHARTAARTLLGLVFFVFGLDYFLHFFPQPTGPMPEGAMAFGGALMKTGYMFPLIKGTEVAVGALLLSNRFVPLALALIAPVIVNIVAFHAFLEPSGLVIAIAVAALEVYLAWSYRAAFRPMLAARAA
jgi:hypothetical protein